MADETPDAQRAAMIAAALKQQVPTAALDPTCVWQPSKDQAAITGLNNAAQQGNKLENGGAIFQNGDGQYCYSIPVSSKQGEHIQFNVTPPTGTKLAAIYHTHPDGLDSGSFSPDDVDTANKLKMTSYIKALKSGAIKRFDPGVTPTRSGGIGVARGSSVGTPVPPPA